MMNYTCSGMSESDVLCLALQGLIFVFDEGYYEMARSLQPVDEIGSGVVSHGEVVPF